MYLKSLYLKNFRSYEEAFFEFLPTVNLIYGPNAVGKTTILEAIHYLMFGRSFRLCHQQDLIRTDAPHFYLEAVFFKHGIEQQLKIHTEKKERKIVHNATSIQTIANLLGLIQGVIMTPDDANLIKGSPSERRRFLDAQIAQTDPLYVHHLTRYHRAVKQRNQLLKQKSIDTINLWEQEMAQAAAYIVSQRKNITESLQEPCQMFYSYLTEATEELTLDYYSLASSCTTSEQMKEFYLQQWNKHRSKELLMGHTLIGPHKDDLIIKIGKKEGRYFASEGQQRSSIAALHVGAWSRLKERAKDVPLWMVDDIGVSLDKKRREKLLEHLCLMGQLFLTTTEADVVQLLQQDKKVFSLPLPPLFFKIAP